MEALGLLGLLGLGAIFVALSIVIFKLRGKPEQGSFSESIDGIKSHGSSKRGLFNATYEAKVSEQEGKKKKNLADEIKLTTEMEVAAQTAEVNVIIGQYDSMNKLDATARIGELDKVQHENQLVILESATAAKLSPSVYEQKTVLEIESDLRVKEHRAMKQIDVEMDLLQKLNTIEAIWKVKNLSQTTWKIDFKEAREALLALMEEESRIEQSHHPAQIKGKMLERNKKDQEMWEAILDAIRTRLMEARSKENVESVGEFITAAFADSGLGSGASEE